MNNYRFAVAALAAALLSTPALAADNMTVKDSTGATVTMRSKDVGSGLQATVHIPFDSAGGDMTDTALHALHVEGVAGGVAQPVSGSVSLTGTLPGFTSTPSFTLGAAIPTGGNVIGVTGNAQGSATAGQSGPLVQGAVTSGAPTYTTAQTAPLSLDTAGNLRVNLITGVLPTGAATAANQSTANTSLATIASNSGGPIPAGTNVIGHVIADTGSTTAVTALPALAAGTAIVGKVGIDQTTDGTTNAVHLVAGTALAGKFGIDQTTPGTTNAVAIGDGSSVTLGSKADAATCATANTAMACFRQLHADVTTAIPAGTNLIGKVGIDQTTPGTTNAVVATPATSGGLSLCRVVTGTTGFCKASAGQVFQLVYQNTNAAARYIQIYNKASAPTVGTDVPVATVPMALTSVGSYNLTELGAAFSTGIAWAVTTDDVATPTTAGTSGDLHMTLSYK